MMSNVLKLGQRAAGAPAPIEQNQSFQAIFDRIAAGEARRERDRILPREQIAWLSEAGFGALRQDSPERPALSFRELLRLVIGLAEADANVAHIYRNHFTIAEQYARRSASAAGQRLHEAVGKGAVIGLGNTELGAHDVGNAVPRTRIWKTPSGYRLEGTKYYTTGTLYADYVLVRAADDASRLASVIIPTQRTGVDIVDDWAGTGQRLTASGTANFNNVAVDEDEVVFDTPGVGYGLAYANTQAQLYLTAINAGIIRALLRDATQVVAKRKRTFYHAPSIAKTDPLLLSVIGRIHAHAFAAEAAVLAAADRLDEISRIRDAVGDDIEAAHEASLAAASAKIVVDALAIESGSLVFDAGGASVATAEHNLDRHWRNARTLASHNPGAYKAAAIGAYHVNATPLPRGSFF